MTHNIIDRQVFHKPNSGFGMTVGVYSQEVERLQHEKAALEGVVTMQRTQIAQRDAVIAQHHRVTVQHQTVLTEMDKVIDTLPILYRSRFDVSLRGMR